MDRKAQISLITSELVRSSWTPLSGTAIAFKDFDTAVGAKTAHVYISNSADDDPNRTLMGEYQSEGRNILEAHSWLIPKDADADQISRIAAGFADEAEAAVLDSYAARLRDFERG